MANIFRKSIEYAGIYQNGIVLTEISTEDGETRSDDSPVQAPAVPVRQSAPVKGGYTPAMNPRTEMITVEFPSGIALSYPKNLAFAFTMGIFREQTAALEDAVQKEVKKHESNDTKDDISPTS